MARYIRFSKEGAVSYGRQEGETIHILSGNLFEGPADTGRTVPLAEVKLLAPCTPSKAVCVGLNYLRHAGELEMKLPDEPCTFLKPDTSVINPDDNIVYWPQIERLDYEAELCAVIGRECFAVEEDEVDNVVFGYTAGNDVTARDLQSKDIQWTRSKGFNTFLPFGPAIVTGLDPTNLRVRSFLNGKIRQDETTARLIFPVRRLISFISKVMTLRPGDLIMTGTPVGVGAMQIGDIIEVDVEGIGRISNRVVAPPRK